MNHKHHTASAAWYKSPAVLGLLAILGVAGALFLVQHWEHAVPYWPWLLILAIPLLHMFMHGGHGAHGGHDGQDSREDSGGHAGQGGGCCGGHGSRGGHGGHGGHGSREGSGGHAGQGGGCCGGHSGDTAPKKDVKQPVGQVDR